MKPRSAEHALEWSNEADKSVEKRLFLKTRDGKIFGWLLLNCGWLAPPVSRGGNSKDAQGSFQVRYVFNPTGSRSLEPDPKRIYQSYAEYFKAQPKK